MTKRPIVRRTRAIDKAIGKADDDADPGIYIDVVCALHSKITEEQYGKETHRHSGSKDR